MNVDEDACPQTLVGAASPTADPVRPPGLNTVLERNIGALQARRLREENESALEERIADAITRFAGSMRFVYLHLFVFGLWLIANLGLLPLVPRWDPSFVVLAMIASVEAIFLSTFVLLAKTACPRRQKNVLTSVFKSAFWPSTS